MLLEKTQRRLCRLLFILGCVLPTLAVAGYSAARLAPGYEAGLLAEAGGWLGVEVACESVATPRPGAYELRGVTLVDPANGETLATCGELVVEREGAGWRFSATEVSLWPRATRGVWADRLLASEKTVRGRIAGLSLGDRETLEKASVTLTPDELRVRGADGFELQVADEGAGPRVELDTAGREVALAWLPRSPLVSLLGDASRFSGAASYDASTDAGELRGRVQTPDLAVTGLVASSGEVALETYRWRAGQLERLNGRIDLRDGQLAGEAVWGACHRLETEAFDKLKQHWSDPSQRAWVPFSQLACEIELDEQGVTLVAGCGEIDGAQRGGAVAHAILELDGEPLLREPLTRPLPTQRLVQAWFPDRPAELPASPAAIEMMRSLPGAVSP